MKTLISLILATAAVAPTLAKASSFCVGNYSYKTIDWDVKKAGASVLSYEQSKQGAGQEWICTDVDDNQRFEVEVSTDQGRYTHPSCLISVKGGDWVHVRSDENGNVQCDHLNDSGQIHDVTYETAGASTGWTLKGTVFVDGPVQGSTIMAWNKAGKMIGVEKNATQANGYFEMKLKEPMPYRVEARNGTLKGKSFQGTLMTYVSDEFQVLDDQVYLNAPSTLVAEVLKKYPDVSLDRAETEVKHFLDLGSTTDLTQDVNNPYIKMYSGQTLLKEAKQYGGFDHYVTQLVSEMESSPNNVHAFPAPKLLNNPVAVWLIKEFGAGILQGIGAKTFASLMGGNPDPNAKVYEMLNKVMAELANIQRSIDQLNIVSAEHRYETRTDSLNKIFGHIKNDLQTFFEKENEAEAKDMTAARKAWIASSSTKLVNDIASSLEYQNFVIDVNTEFQPSDSGTAPFQQLWANAAAANQGAIIRPSFFPAIDDQVNQWVAFQSIALNMYTDAKRARDLPGDKFDADAFAKKWVGKFDDEKRVLPRTFPFTNAAVVKEIEEKRAFYQFTGNKLWKTSTTPLASYMTIEEYQRKPNPNFTVAEDKAIFSLVNETNVRDKTWTEALQDWGFSKKDADAYKMIYDQMQHNILIMIFYYKNTNKVSDHVFPDLLGEYENQRKKFGLSPPGGIDILTYSVVKN